MIKRSDQINRWLQLPTAKPPLSSYAENDTKKSSSVTLAVIALVAVCFLIIDISFLSKVVILSIIGLSLGNLVSFWDHKIVLKMGGLLILIIMAILGLKLNFNALEIPTMLILISVIWLVLHYIGMMLIAYYLKIHAAWIPVASMANLGGISTAPAVTAAYEKQWMPHAIVLSILSMVSGTAWGLLTIYLFGYMI